MNPFTTNDPAHKEFMKAGLDFIEQLSRISPLPIYKYFPTKAYKKFIAVTGRMRELGKLNLYALTVLHSVECACIACTVMMYQRMVGYFR